MARPDLDPPSPARRQTSARPLSVPDDSVDYLELHLSRFLSLIVFHVLISHYGPFYPLFVLLCVAPGMGYQSLRVSSLDLDLLKPGFTLVQNE